MVSWVAFWKLKGYERANESRNERREKDWNGCEYGNNSRH
jgi:hypothetical protein